MVTIARAAASVAFPCRFMLVAAMNPCPCGYYGDPKRDCRCGSTLIQRYRARISGPLLDRIDIHVEVPRAPFKKLSDERRGEPSAAIRARVEAARGRQAARFAHAGRGGVTHLDVPYHIHHFTESGLVSLLKDKGFRVLNIKRMDLEHNPYRWLQTLFNLTGFKKNLLYNLLKNRELRERTMGAVSAGELVLTVLLLPLYLPLSLVLSIFEAYILKTGGTVTVYAVRE